MQNWTMKNKIKNSYVKNLKVISAFNTMPVTNATQFSCLKGQTMHKMAKLTVIRYQWNKSISN